MFQNVAYRPTVYKTGLHATHIFNSGTYFVNAVYYAFCVKKNHKMHTFYQDAGILKSSNICFNFIGFLGICHLAGPTSDHNRTQQLRTQFVCVGICGDANCCNTCMKRWKLIISNQSSYLSVLEKNLIVMNQIYFLTFHACF